MLAVVDQGGLGLPDRDYYLKDDAKLAGAAHQVRRARAADAGAARRQAARRRPRGARRSWRWRRRSRRSRSSGWSGATPRTCTTRCRAPTSRRWRPSSSGRRTSRRRARPRSRRSTSPTRSSSRACPTMIKTRPLGGLEDVPALAPGPPAGAAALRGLRRRELRLLRQDADRARRSCGRAGSAASTASTTTSATRSASATSRRRSARRASSAWPMMVAALEKALEQDIQALPWMTDPTKKQGLEKLRAIANKIGYPDKWRDYTTVKILRDDAVGNAARAAAFEFKRDLAKIGKPVDRGEWQMTPAHGQRVLQPAAERHHLPGRHPAAAVLRQRDGRRGQLRRHRHGHRPRADPRLRRLRAASSTPRATSTTGGRKATARRSRSARSASPTSTAPTRRSTT